MVAAAGPAAAGVAVAIAADVVAGVIVVGCRCCRCCYQSIDQTNHGIIMNE